MHQRLKTVGQCGLPGGATILGHGLSIYFCLHIPALSYCGSVREVVDLPETATLRPPGHCGRKPGCPTTHGV